ncbi:MAG: hypothetical protein JW727_04015 [Candidatus Aenigmarchaeota archaeon]|nr:hypothetical protein [Candidatus Aenigmarchaeota archaeon]
MALGEKYFAKVGNWVKKATSQRSADIGAEAMLVPGTYLLVEGDGVFSWLGLAIDALAVYQLHKSGALGGAYDRVFGGKEKKSPYQAYQDLYEAAGQ